jgi:hypothetical protein
MITHDSKCTREIISRITMPKTKFNKKQTRFAGELDLNLKNKLEMLHLEHRFVLCCNLDTS